MTRRLSLLGLVLCAPLLPGCSAGGPADAGRPVTVMLDWTPNPIHAGLLTAEAEGLDRKEGVKVSLRSPSSSSDGARLLLAGRADLAVMDIHDLAAARARGRRLVAVMAVTGRPLSAVIVAPRVRSPKDLEGRTVATTGVPSDAAVVRTVVRGAGGNPARVRLVNAGYGASAALIGGQASGALGFINEEGVTIPARHPGFRVFRADAWGAPDYPELVLVARADQLRSKASEIGATVRAFAKGTAEAVKQPERAKAVVAAAVGKAGSGMLARRMAAALAALRPASGSPGSFDIATLHRWARWEQASGLVGSVPDVGAAFDARFSRRP